MEAVDKTPWTSWFLRSPLHRLAWAALLGARLVPSLVRRLLAGADPARRYCAARLTKRTLDDPLHAQALEVVPRGLLDSELRDFVPSIPWAAMVERKFQLEQRALQGQLAARRPPAVF
jgi:hypothetical protein